MAAKKTKFFKKNQIILLKHVLLFLGVIAVTQNFYPIGKDSYTGYHSSCHELEDCSLIDNEFQRRIQQTSINNICSENDNATSILVGAFYYPWWREKNFVQTKAEPYIGPYDTSNSVVISKHLAQAKRGGIDVLALEWTGPHPSDVSGDKIYTEYDIDKRLLMIIESIKKEFVEKKFQDERLFREIYLRRSPWGSYFIFYDQAIRMHQKYEYSIEKAYDFDNKIVYNTFVSDLIHIGKKYFDDIDYFRIDGKPVVWLYLSRVFKGNYEKALKDVREAFDYRIYIIGDEIFNTIALDKAEKRIKNFDAIGCYGIGIDSMYYRDEANTKEIADIAIPIYKKWFKYVSNLRNVMGNPIDFIWPVQPQYDDDHIKDRPLNGEFFCDSPEDFEYFLKRTKEAIDELPNGKGIVFVTSFNEWYETTSVEASSIRGFPYRYNFGFDFLDILFKIFKK
ncbi:MAG: glycoside hydrolase family 99-like domain-containing protein [Acidobacteriota bacterium]